MKLPAARVSAFLKQPDANIRAVLVYGPDNGLVRERADILGAGICPDLKDAFRVTELTAGALTSDPARLSDEASALSLMGGRRLIRVRDASDGLATLFAGFFASPPPGDGFVVVEAGDLAGKSSLRKVFEGASAGAAIACYGDARRDLSDLIREVLGKYGIGISSDAQSYLVANLGNDRMVSRGELEKLALYAGDRGRVELDDATACVGDSASLSVDDIVYAVAEGRGISLERALVRALQEGEAPISILRAAMRHFQKLHLVGSRRVAGASLEDALRSLRPPLFFKLADRFKAQLDVWPPNRAMSALDVLMQAEVNGKRSVLPQETICRDALLRVARAAAVRRN